MINWTSIRIVFQTQCYIAFKFLISNNNYCPLSYDEYLLLIIWISLFLIITLIGIIIQGDTKIIHLWKSVLIKRNTIELWMINQCKEYITKFFFSVEDMFTNVQCDSLETLNRHQSDNRIRSTLYVSRM